MAIRTPFSNHKGVLARGALPASRAPLTRTPQPLFPLRALLASTPEPCRLHLWASLASTPRPCGLPLFFGGLPVRLPLSFFMRVPLGLDSL